MNFFNSAIGLAILASILYGLNAPVMKMASDTGASASGMAFMYGLGAMLIAVCIKIKNSTAMYATVESVLWSIPLGLISGAAFYLIGMAFKRAGGEISIITTIIASHCLVSTLSAIIFMNELARVSLLKLGIGTVLVLAGVYVVSTSIKTS